MEHQKKLKIELLIVSVALVLTLAAVGITTRLYHQEASENEDASAHIQNLTSEVDELNRQIADLQQEVTEAQSEYTDLHEEHTDLKEEHSDLKADYSSLLTSLTDITDELSAKETELSDAVMELENKNRRIEALEKRLNRQIDRYDTAQEEMDRLTVEIEDLNEQIAGLEADIVRLRTAAAVRSELDAAEKTTVESVSEPAPEPVQEPAPELAPEPIPEFDTTEEKLMYLLQYGAPERWYEIPGDPDNYYLDSAKIVAYGYYDLTTGDAISYNADSIYYSASLIKAPYIYSVLLEISEFEKSKTERDEEGNIIYLPGEEKYNLDEVWTYDSATMFEEGSGEIREMSDGTQLTWRELFAYVLLYSDNVAWNQIMDRFGFTTFYRLVGQFGIQGTSSDFMNLSVNDCVKFLREIYKFFETGDPYALFMKENMMNSRHQEMICASFPAGTAAHKYGWDTDAYHDMAIIFDEHPYLIVIMTDLHDGESKDTAYINFIVELTKTIHAERYGG